MKLFTEWLQTNIQEMIPNQGSDIPGAVTTLRNHFANSQAYPNDWLLQGINVAKGKVGGNPQAIALLEVMENLAQRFLQNIRNERLGIQTPMQGKGLVLKMPGVGERGSDDYQRLYQRLMQDLSVYVDRLSQLT